MYIQNEIKTANIFHFQKLNRKKELKIENTNVFGTLSER